MLLPVHKEPLCTADCSPGITQVSTASLQLANPENKSDQITYTQQHCPIVALYFKTLNKKQFLEHKQNNRRQFL